MQSSFLYKLATNLEALCEKFKVVDECFHRVLHLCPVWWDTLSIICPDFPSWHVVQTLLYYPQALSHLSHPHQISVIAITPGANRNIKVHQVIRIIWLGFPQVILYA